MKKIKSNIIISAPHVVIPRGYWNPLLGEILRDADLITDAQLKTVLQDKQLYGRYKMGELLALRGWLKQETVDFFVEQWSSYIQQGPQYPIGEYLKQAALLTPEDIKDILEQQKRQQMRFGEIAIAQGLIKPKTLTFFLNHLFCQADDDTLFVA